MFLIIINIKSIPLNNIPVTVEIKSLSFCIKHGEGTITLKGSLDIRIIRRVSPRSLVANVLDCGIVVSEFELHWCYYVHFQAKALGKVQNYLSLSQLWFE